MFNKIAPNNALESFRLKIQQMTNEELQSYIEKAKKLGISEEQIKQGIEVLNALKK